MSGILERFLKPETNPVVIIENEEPRLRQAARDYMSGVLPFDKFGEIMDEYCERRTEVMRTGREMKRGRDRFLDQSVDLVVA